MKKVKKENGREKNLEELGHCKECSVLSGCYFVKSKLPKKKAEGDGLLHPHCDCKLNGMVHPLGKITCNTPLGG